MKHTDTFQRVVKNSLILQLVGKQIMKKFTTFKICKSALI